MSFESIQGQDRAIASLRKMTASGRIPSALLFSGPHNIGKRTTALTLAKALNCIRDDGDSCDICPSCRKIDEGVHPDVKVVTAEGQFIKIDQVRGVTEMLTLIPLEAKKRMVVFKEADRMNSQAANALLKTLEEPPADTLLVLCAENERSLPETITSRCLPVRFLLLTEETVRGLMNRGDSLNEQELNFAVRFSQGRLRPELPEKAGQWMILRDEALHGMGRLDGSAFGWISEKFAKWSSGDDWKFLLEWLETWFRDLALLGSGAENPGLINPDREDELSQWMRRFSPTVADLCYRKVLDTRENIRINANKALALDALWLGIKEVTHN